MGRDGGAYFRDATLAVEDALLSGKALALNPECRNAVDGDQCQAGSWGWVGNGPPWKRWRPSWPLWALLGCCHPPAHRMPVPQVLMIVAALPGALAAWAGVTVTVVMFLWNKLDRRFDELKDGLTKLEARQREDNTALNEKLDRLLESRLPAPR